jgi:hypothetical protein
VVARHAVSSTGAPVELTIDGGFTAVVPLNCVVVVVVVVVTRNL